MVTYRTKIEIIDEDIANILTLRYSSGTKIIQILRLETGRRSLQGLGNTIPKVLPGSLTHAVFEDIQ